VRRREHSSAAAVLGTPLVGALFGLATRPNHAGAKTPAWRRQAAKD